MKLFRYVIDHYGVPACMGRIVEVDGRRGVIASDEGHYIGVNFDDSKPCVIRNCHPTWRVVYGEIGKVREPTTSQRRYDAYLDADSSLTFGEWLKEQSRHAKARQRYGSNVGNTIVQLGS